jgi:hypothetical protein
VTSEKLNTKGSLRILRFAFFLLLFTVYCSLLTVSAQKNEHYNSPLYSPKTYDPAEFAATTGLPNVLKTVGIEQKLGEQLPLDTELNALQSGFEWLDRFAKGYVVRCRKGI